MPNSITLGDVSRAPSVPIGRYFIACSVVRNVHSRKGNHFCPNRESHAQSVTSEKKLVRSSTAHLCPACFVECLSKGDGRRVSCRRHYPLAQARGWSGTNLRRFHLAALIQLLINVALKTGQWEWNAWMLKSRL